MAVCSRYKQCKRDSAYGLNTVRSASMHGRTLWPVHVESVPKYGTKHDQTDHARPDFGQQRFGRKLVEIGAFDYPSTSPTIDLYSQ